ncbi:DUF559 domain-containing protein [Sphingobium sp.]|nr:DUF559 domain-containing protein [Sphingobium sp.]HUD92495.1 DUF559 domain-containing protein [Sphingobium sp.]
MRANPTSAEQRLWLALRANRLENQQFTRQTIISPLYRRLRLQGCTSRY